MLCWEVDVQMFSLPCPQLFPTEQRNKKPFNNPHPILGLTNQKSLHNNLANGQINSILPQTPCIERTTRHSEFRSDIGQILNRC